MASQQFAVVTRQIGRLFESGTVAGLSEGQLLDRFVTRRDDAAFEAIVARHGPMVLGVCRGILHDPNDVDDAFQATFLVLVRKAADLRQQDLLANWLYGVAFRVARRAREQAIRRTHADATTIDPPDRSSANNNETLDVRPLIHEEVNRLPESYRAAIVLCYLEGQTHEAAAVQLGWPIGTVKGRLARAKEMLRVRLTRKGLAVSTGSLAIALAKESRAAVPEVLAHSTTTSAMTVATAAGFAAASLSPHVVSLATGVLQMMTPTSFKYIATLAVAGLLSAGGVSAYQAPAAKPDQAKAQPNKAGSTASTKEEAKSPELLRAEERLKLAEQGYESALAIARNRGMGGGGMGGGGMGGGGMGGGGMGGGGMGGADFQVWASRLSTARTELEEIHRKLEGPNFEVNEARRKLERAVQKEAAIKKNLANTESPNPASNKVMLIGARFAVLEAEDELKKAEQARVTHPNPTPPSPPAKETVSLEPTQPQAKSAEELRLEERVKLIEKLIQDKSKIGVNDPNWFDRLNRTTSQLEQARQNSQGPMYEVNIARKKLEEARRGEATVIDGADNRDSSEVAKLEARINVLEAEDQLRNAQKNLPSNMNVTVPAATGTPATTPQKKANDVDVERNKQIADVLEKVVPMNFPNDTPLEDVLKYIKQATKDAKGKSIPIYLNPLGMQEAEKTPTSTIKLDIDGLPLRTTLRLMLDELGLGYEIRDGLIEINSIDAIKERNAPKVILPMGGGMGGMGFRGGMGGMM